MKNRPIKTLTGALLFVLMSSPVVFSSPETEQSDLSLSELLNMTITTASKSEEKTLDAPGAVSILNQDEIKRFGGATLKELLVRVPSLNRGRS